MQPVDMDGNQTMMEWMFEGHRIRVVMINDEPWWVAKDVCEALQIANSRDAVSRLDEDEKNTVAITDGNRGNPNTTIINEAGLYQLTFTSRVDTAKRFRRWLAHEVLPSIRKTGEYKTPERRQECEIAAKQVAVMEMKARTEQAKLLVDAVHRLEHRLSDLLIERILIASTNLMAGYDAIGIPTDGPSFTEPGRTRFPDLKPYWKPF